MDCRLPGGHMINRIKHVDDEMTTSEDLWVFSWLSSAEDQVYVDSLYTYVATKMQFRKQADVQM